MDVAGMHFHLHNVLNKVNGMFPTVLIRELKEYALALDINIVVSTIDDCLGFRDVSYHSESPHLKYTMYVSMASEGS